MLHCTSLQKNKNSTFPAGTPRYIHGWRLSLELHVPQAAAQALDPFLTNYLLPHHSPSQQLCFKFPLPCSHQFYSSKMSMHFPIQHKCLHLLFTDFERPIRENFFVWSDEGASPNNRSISFVSFILGQLSNPEGWKHSSESVEKRFHIRIMPQKYSGLTKLSIAAWTALYHSSACWLVSHWKSTCKPRTVLTKKTFLRLVTDAFSPRSTWSISAPLRSTLNSGLKAVLAWTEDFCTTNKKQGWEVIWGLGKEQGSDKIWEIETCPYHGSKWLCIAK